MLKIPIGVQNEEQNDDKIANRVRQIPFFFEQKNNGICRMDRNLFAAPNEAEIGVLSSCCCPNGFRIFVFDIYLFHENISADSYTERRYNGYTCGIWCGRGGSCIRTAKSKFSQLRSGSWVSRCQWTEYSL